MLPFLKNRDDGLGTGTVDTKTRKPDEPAEYGMLDAIWDDLASAIKEDDKARGVTALKSLCEHIQDLDIEQDNTTGDGDDD